MYSTQNKGTLQRIWGFLKPFILGGLGGAVLALIADQRVIVGVIVGMLVAIVIVIPHQWRHHWKSIVVVGFGAYCVLTSSWMALAAACVIWFAYQMVSRIAQLWIMLVLSVIAIMLVSVYV